MSEDGRDFNIQGAQNIKSKQDFICWLNPVIINRENHFATLLKTWKTKNSLTIHKTDDIFSFGEYRAVNWKISGLKIKYLPIHYYITSAAKNRAENTILPV
ncbi:hypothetical protein [Spiroplasma endosymbiont of Nebria brevicollis]|uniref:hypothetical protein n=1 Tax=Spiroplasma endosymbiont of Nebria brevicollis TaxID=3066284 RepID=UPI00313E6C8F